MAAAKKLVTEPTQFDIDKRNRSLAMLDARAWRPSPGDILTAPMVGLRRGGENSEYGTYPILVFERMDGYPFPFDDTDFVAWHAYHTIAQEALMVIKPRPVDRPILTVKYIGRVTFGEMVEGSNGPVYVERQDKADYENYTVLEGDGSDLVIDSFDWEKDVRAPKN